MVDIVTGLSVDRERLCPHQEATVTAQTSPPDTLVTWKVDGEEVESASNTIEIGGLVHPVGPGHTVMVEAVLANTQSVQIRRVETRVDIILDPPPAAIGPFQSDAYVITSEPAMPAIRAIASGGISGNWTVRVNIDATLVFEICRSIPPSMIKSIEFPAPAGGSAIDIDFGGAIVGGKLAVGVNGVVNGCPASGGDGAWVMGTNPSRSDIRESFPNDTIRRIACRESGQRQFEAPADGGIGSCPLFGRADRVGIMMTANATDEQVWNWRANLDRGIEVFDERLDAARSYPAQVALSAEFQDLVAGFNAIRLQDGMPAITINVPEFTTGDLDDNLQQLELDAIRGYDGWFGQDRFGHELHEFRIAVAPELARTCCGWETSTRWRAPVTRSGSSFRRRSDLSRKAIRAMWRAFSLSDHSAARPMTLRCRNRAARLFASSITSITWSIRLARR
ncbi:hypothetical protein FB388_1281 [Pseudonocardia cypriaca]|uniref:Uncharacterized protein n=1 Tax=Pseudonocardia cypriaca TaxID=882449 RepID=A0A543GCW1_9PSEU|nr:hypothetical protein FB388_1281 [Pseudonocardia cypriaca]